MELKTLLEWLLNALAGNIVSVYFIKIMLTIFPNLERYLVPNRAWVTGSDVLYTGGYEDTENSGELVFLRKGSKFPPATNGTNTSWQMKIWDAGEAEEAAKGCRSQLGEFLGATVILATFGGFLYFVYWIIFVLPTTFVQP